MLPLMGTKTEQNLMTAFMGQSIARNKYTYFASKAKEEGYEQIASVFLETAENEKEHARLWFRLLQGGEILYTIDNLKSAEEGENFEWTHMYSRMAKEAKEEGFDRIAFLFEEVGKIEKEHEERFKRILSDIEKGLVFYGYENTIWKCRNCGYEAKGNRAPKICLLCDSIQAFFEVKEENY